MFTVQQYTGRLVEARVSGLANAAEVHAYQDAFAPVLRDPAARPVLCADHRPVVIYSQPVAADLIELFRKLNTRWERVAILVAPTNATLAMQLQRIVRESNYESRQVFFEAREAVAFLGAVLTDAERVRVASFLSEPVSSPGVATRRA